MKNEIKNTHAILSDLSGPVQENTDAIDFYFNQVNGCEILNPFMAGGTEKPIGNNEALPPEFFNGFGIRRMILDTQHGKLSFSENNFTDLVDKDAAAFKWSALKGDLMIEDLKMLIGNSQIVEFKNWSDVQNASDIWDNLRRNVIKGLKRNDFEFVFFLGDTAKKFAFEVDEFLDTISDYSLHGRVTLILEEQIVTNLCGMLYGWDEYIRNSTLPGLCEKGRSVFDLINIDHLIIDSFPATLSFSRERQIEITAGKTVGVSKSNGNHFDTGYILGLLLKMDAPHSIALGQAVSGLYAGNEYQPDSRMLLSYIDKWIGETESLEPEESQLSIA